MKTLELKHLAPYLPYELKMYHYCSSSNNKYIRDLQSVGIDRIKIGDVDWDLDNMNYKPILKPLTSITVEQLIELFEIAYEQVYKTVDKSLTNFHFHGWDGEKDFGLMVKDETFIYGFSMDFERQQDFRFSYRHIGADYENSQLCLYKIQLFNKLFEWHFDVFGLIDKGLAIDINNTVSI